MRLGTFLFTRIIKHTESTSLHTREEIFCNFSVSGSWLLCLSLRCLRLLCSPMTTAERSLKWIWGGCLVDGFAIEVLQIVRRRRRQSPSYKDRCIHVVGRLPTSEVSRAHASDFAKTQSWMSTIRLSYFGEILPGQALLIARNFLPRSSRCLDLRVVTTFCMSCC